MDGANADGSTTFPAAEYSAAHSTIAVALLFGCYHFNAVLVLAALLVLPSRLAAAVFGLLLLLLVIPLYEKSQWGQKFSRYVRRYSCGYFRVTFHVEDIKAFDPKQAYVFGYEPHSIVAIGTFPLLECCIKFLGLTKIKFLVNSGVFIMPFLRHIWTWMGCAPVTREKFCSYLEAGYSCIVVPGGTREVLYMEHDSEVVFLKERKGFVRLAIEKGAPLVPVYCFGQAHAYKWRRPRGKFLGRIARAISKSTMMPVVLFWGRFGSPIPFRNPFHIVIGRPIELKKNPRPTADEINEVHMQFIVALEELFEKYKTRAGHPDLQLRVF